MFRNYQHTLAFLKRILCLNLNFLNCFFSVCNFYFYTTIDSFFFTKLLTVSIHSEMFLCTCNCSYQDTTLYTTILVSDLSFFLILHHGLLLLIFSHNWDFISKGSFTYNVISYGGGCSSIKCWQVMTGRSRIHVTWDGPKWALFWWCNMWMIPNLSRFRYFWMRFLLCWHSFH